MYKFDGRIRYSEVDSERKLTVEKMIDYLVRMGHQLLADPI